MRVFSFASIAVLSATALLGLACGGSAPPAESPSSAATSAPTASAVPTATTTTTLTLGDAGDLQGTKLASSSTSAPRTEENDAGAAPAAKKSEPGRSVQDIQAVILARRDEARACYEASLKQHPGIEGDVDIKWVIDPKGNATQVTVDESKSTIHDDTTWKCLAQIIQKISFAPSAKGFETRTHYPFNFHPKHTVGGARDGG